ncbi:MAG: hypothetical protein Kow0042_31480 [Calditrichia bacterium]
MNTSKRKKRRAAIQKVNPETQLLFDELCEVFQKMGIQVRQEPGYFRGGRCLVNGQEFFYVNKNQSIEYNIEMLVSQLKSLDLEKIYLSPKLRILLEEQPTAEGG